MELKQLKTETTEIESQDEIYTWLESQFNFRMFVNTMTRKLIP